MRAIVLGGGSWGTTIGSLAAENTEVLLWCRNEEVASDINEHHRNERYLGDLDLNPGLRATTDLEEAMQSAEMIIMGVPSYSFRSVMEQIKGIAPEAAPIVSLTKGLEKNTRLRMSQVIKDVLPNNPISVLTGPNLAKEILSGHATASVAASQDSEIARMVQNALAIPTFRVYTNSDVIGSELGGALKNVVALGSGISQGLGRGDNTRATVLTRGLAELTRLGVALGGKPETLAGLAGMGDLIATSISPQSRIDLWVKSWAGASPWKRLFKI